VVLFRSFEKKGQREAEAPASSQFCVRKKNYAKPKTGFVQLLLLLAWWFGTSIYYQVWMKKARAVQGQPNYLLLMKAVKKRDNQPGWKVLGRRHVCSTTTSPTHQPSVPLLYILWGEWSHTKRHEKARDQSTMAESTGQTTWSLNDDKRYALATRYAFIYPMWGNEVTRHDTKKPGTNV